MISVEAAMKRSAHYVLWALPVFALTSLLLGNPAQNQTTLRVETRLIQVNVVAQDSKGRPVTGLTRGDFRLFDNGRRVPIDVFSAVPTAYASRGASPNLPPNTFSNRTEGPPPNVIVILLDGLNTEFADQVWSRGQVARFLEKLRPQDRVEIYLLGDHLYRLQTFTGDTRLLLKVAKNTMARAPRQLAAGAPAGPAYSANATTRALLGGSAAEAREEAAISQFASDEEGAFFIRDRVRRSVDAFKAVASHLSQYPGRKDLLWVTAAFPTEIGFFDEGNPADPNDPVIFTREFQSIQRALNNADIALYPVDARGLVAFDGDASTDESIRGKLAASFYATLGTMLELADDTGGKAYHDTNGLTEAMRAAVDDSRVDYTLGFYPRVNWDGSYHELKVKVDRPGVHLRYRKGYYARPDFPEGEKDVNAIFDRALYSPVESKAIGLTVRLRDLTTGRKGKATLGIAVDPRDIKSRNQGRVDRFSLQIVLAQSAADGKVLKSVRADVSFGVRPGAMTRFLEKGLKLEKSVDLAAGATTLELIVRDPASGNVGSVRIPLQS
jgi:VWFA-related protein